MPRGPGRLSQPRPPGRDGGVSACRVAAVRWRAVAHLQRRGVRRVADGLLLAVLLCGLVTPAGALVSIRGHFPIPQLLLVVGQAGAAIDVVTMDVPAASLGDPGSPVPGSQPVRVLILARAPVSSPDFVLTVDSSQPLGDGVGNTIPMTEIAWTSDAGDLPAGAFDGSSTQVITSGRPDRFIQDTLRFRYLNSTVPLAGTYTARVRYTLAIP